jgi:hypothetical protein
MRIRSAFGRIAALLTLLATFNAASAAPIDPIERIEWR